MGFVREEVMYEVCLEVATDLTMEGPCNLLSSSLTLGYVVVKVTYTRWMTIIGIGNAPRSSCMV